MDKVKKNFIITTSVMGTVCLALGLTVGILWGSDFFQEKVDYNAMDINSLEDNNKATFERYEKAGGDYSKFTAYEIANIGLMKVGMHEHTYSSYYGEVIAAGVKQVVRSSNVKDGNLRFKEDLSTSSLVTCAWRFYQDESYCKVYKGKYKSSTSASYKSDDYTNLTLAEYNDIWGKDLSRASIYIISSKTTKEHKVSRDGENYVLSMEMDPAYCVARYIKQMMMTSGLSKAPIFHSVHLDMNLDKNLNLLDVTITEHYEVSMFGVHDSKAIGNEKYTYDDDSFTIPQLNELATYQEK